MPFDTDTGASMAKPRKPPGRASAAASISAQFAARLQHFTAEKGFTQADLAREATKHMPKGKKVGRDNVSLYMRGIQMPGDAKLYAMAKALSIQPSELVPESAATEDSPPVAMKPLEKGLVWLQINQAVPMEMAMDIVAMLRTRREK